MSEYDELNLSPAQPEDDHPAPQTAAPAPLRDHTARRLGWAALVLALLALAVSLVALWRTLPPPPAQPEDDGAVYAQPGDTLTYKDRTLPVHTQVPLNTYDPACFRWQDGRVVYTGQESRPLVGIDVSYYQKVIDWKQVKASGVDYAMIRVGYRGYGSNGLILSDSYFEQNIRGALDAGLEVGVYFFSQAINVWEAEEEAAFVLDAIRGYQVTFPVIFDWEIISNPGARTNGLSSDTLTRCALAFCDKIAKAGYTPGIYFNQDVAYLHYDLSRLADYPFWLAEYRTVPTFHYHFDMWQYTAKGSVPGIDGHVDLNLCFTPFGKDS